MAHKVKFFLVLKQEVVLSKVDLIRHDEHIFPSSGQFLSEEIPSLCPLLELLWAVGVVTAYTIRTAAIQPVNY